MARTIDLSDSINRISFKKDMLANWCQKKFKIFAQQLDAIAPYSYGMTCLLQGLCYANGWGVRKNLETAQKYFSQLSVGDTVWFGHFVTFMECTIVKIESDRILLMEKNPRVMNAAFARFLTFPPKEIAPWDSCLARKWMNTAYLEDTFYKHERNLMLKTKVSTSANPFISKSAAVKEVIDKVFPLSIQEFMDFKEMHDKKRHTLIWTFTTEGPEAICNGGDYITRITEKKAEYHALYFGNNPDDLYDTKLKGNTASFFRTAGSSSDNKAFTVKDLIFYEGEGRNKIQCSDIKIGYNPAFWISLK